MNGHVMKKLLEECFGLAIKMAQESGKCLLKGWGSKHKISQKEGIEIVTQTDLESQNIILGMILDRFPDHSVLSEEEGGFIEGSGSGRWIIDPLDGTANFAHGFPFFGVSIGFELDGELRLGVIYNPVMKEFYSACQGIGAFFNNEPIKVSTIETVRKSLLCTGFPYDLSVEREDILSRFLRLLNASQGVRRPGSAAVDLGYVATGVFEVFWEQGLKPWDVAAGAAIVREAGGKVTNYEGKPFDVEKGEILATNGRVHDEMMELLKLDENGSH